MSVEVLASVLYSGPRVQECTLTLFISVESILLFVPTVKVVLVLEFSHWSRFNNYLGLCLLTVYDTDSRFIEQNKLSSHE